MTVSTQVSRNEYTGNGATTQYDFTFRILDKSHLLVQTLDTSESIVTLTLGTDYTVTGVNRYNGGKVVLTSALPAGYKISIERSTPVTQEASIRNQGGFFPEIHEDALDKLTMLVQQAYGWWSGLSLRKPSWLANYYDALNNRIRNLRDPSQAQDAATKGYADNLYQGAISHSDSNFKRTLRVPESEVGMLPGISGRRKKILAFNDTGNPIAVLPESGSAADVMIELASSEGYPIVAPEKVKANQYHSLADIMSRMKTYSDYGKTEPVYGFDTEFYAAVFNDAPADNNLFLPGRLNLSSDLYGTSDRAVLLSLHGNEYHSFRSQIVSGDTVTLSKYGMTEDLLVYGGMQGKSSVKTTNPDYTTNTLKINDGADTSKVKTGSVIKTSDGYWAHVVSLLGTTITVTGWYKSGVAGVPMGASAYLNHVDKTYFSNMVMWIPQSYTGTKAVGAEWDFMIASPDVTEKNGLDMVIHNASKYDMDTAFYVRSAIAGRAWATGMRVNDFTFAALVTGRGVGDVQAKYDTLFMSGSEYGVQFNGNGGVNVKTSQRWRYSNDSSVYPTNKNRWGFDISGGRISAAAISGTPITLSNMFYYVSNAVPFSLILPSTNLVAGQVIEFGFLGTAAITVSCASSSITVNGSQTYTFAPLKTWTQGRAVWAGTSWNFYS